MTIVDIYFLLFCIYRYCGLKDPSWSELKHFVEFLNIQLESCENSVFCKEEAVGDVMSGLKTFVVKFMIRMSKVFNLSQFVHNKFTLSLYSMELIGFCYFIS